MLRGCATGPANLSPPPHPTSECTAPAGAVLFATQQFSDQKCNFISMCPLEACSVGGHLGVMGYDDSWVGCYLLSFALVFEEKRSFLSAQPWFPSLGSCVRCPLGWLKRLHHGAASVTSKTDEEVMEREKKRDALDSEFQKFFFFFALWKMLVHSAKNESM